MAILRYLRLLRDPRPLTAATAAKLKTLLHIQLAAFLLTLVLLTLAVATRHVPETWAMICGFGLGWILTVRMYVWVYVE